MSLNTCKIYIYIYIYVYKEVHTRMLNIYDNVRMAPTTKKLYITDGRYQMLETVVKFRLFSDSLTIVSFLFYLFVF